MTDDFCIHVVVGAGMIAGVVTAGGDAMGDAGKDTLTGDVTGRVAAGASIRGVVRVTTVILPADVEDVHPAPNTNPETRIILRMMRGLTFMDRF